jgi:hypothetical protein
MSSMQERLDDVCNKVNGTDHKFNLEEAVNESLEKNEGLTGQINEIVLKGFAKVKDKGIPVEAYLKGIGEVLKANKVTEIIDSEEFLKTVEKIVENTKIGKLEIDLDGKELTDETIEKCVEKISDTLSQLVEKGECDDPNCPFCTGKENPVDFLKERGIDLDEMIPCDCEQCKPIEPDLDLSPAERYEDLFNYIVRISKDKNFPWAQIMSQHNCTLKDSSFEDNEYGRFMKSILRDLDKQLNGIGLEEDEVILDDIILQNIIDDEETVELVKTIDDEYYDYEAKIRCKNGACRFVKFNCDVEVEGR